jgi:DNA-directed RNA polymerase subunit beta'
MRRIAAERDLKVIQEARAEAEAAAALAAPVMEDIDVTEIDADLATTPESRD